MHRTLQPELLDSLGPTDPAALHNRRDLRITNRVMGNHRWLARTLRVLVQPGERVLELGAGEGDLAFRLHGRGVDLDGLDLWPRPAAWNTAHAWHQADLLQFQHYADYRVIIGNLIFHQFDAVQLATLGQRLQENSRLIIACEPARRRLSQHLFRTLAPLLGAHAVSLHDADVSIAAGFRNDELPQLLGLSPAAWKWRCHPTALGAYRMIAQRRVA